MDAACKRIGIGCGVHLANSSTAWVCIASGHCTRKILLFWANYFIISHAMESDVPLIVNIISAGNISQ